MPEDSWIYDYLHSGLDASAADPATGTSTPGPSTRDTISRNDPELSDSPLLPTAATHAPAEFSRRDVTITASELARRLGFLQDERELVHGEPFRGAELNAFLQRVQLSRSKWYYMIAGNHVTARDIPAFERIGREFDVPAAWLYRNDEPDPERIATAANDILRLRGRRLTAAARSIGELSPRAEQQIQEIVYRMEAEGL